MLYGVQSSDEKNRKTRHFRPQEVVTHVASCINTNMYVVQSVRIWMIEKQNGLLLGETGRDLFCFTREDPEMLERSKKKAQ